MKKEADVYQRFRQIQDEADSIYNKGYTLEIAIILKNGEKVFTEMFFTYIDFVKQVVNCPNDNGGIKFSDVRNANVTARIPFADKQFLKPLD